MKKLCSYTLKGFDRSDLFKLHCTHNDSTGAAATRGSWSGQTAAPGLDLIIILSVDRAIELRRKQIEYGERDTKMRTLNRDSTVPEDKEKRREVGASIHIRVQKEVGSGNHRPPPGPAPGHSHWGTRTHHRKGGPSAPSSVKELTQRAACTSAEYLETNHWTKGESGSTPQAFARLV